MMRLRRVRQRYHTRGRTYLEELGAEVSGRFSSSEQAKKALLFLEHTLAINDILIAASLLARDFEDITLAHREHEATLKTKPLRVTYMQRLREGGETAITQTLIPDAWLDMYVGDRKKQRYWRFSIWLELDRGTIQARKFIRKARSIIEYLKSGEYQKRFHSEVALIAFVTTAGQDRVQQICTWIHEEAERTDDTGIEPLFFTTAISSPPDPLDFFFSPLWLNPGSDKPTPLFHTQAE